MKRHLSLVVMAFLFITTFFSCKKNDLIKEQNPPANQSSIQKIKTWYDNLSTINTANVGTPNWEKLRYSTKYKSYIIPINIDAHDFSTKASVYKYLVVNENDKGEINRVSYVSVLIDQTKSNAFTQADITPELLSFNAVPGNFNGAVLQYDIENKPILAAHYEDGKLVLAKVDKCVDKPVTVNNYYPEECEDGPQCIAWYWQTYVNGVLWYEEYLFTTCTCNGGGGGGGGGGGNGCNMTGPQADQALSSISSAQTYFITYEDGNITTDQYGVKRKAKNSHWEFLKLTILPGYTPEYSANFTGRVIQQNNTAPWKWEEFQFSNTAISGGSEPPCFEVHLNMTVSTAIAGNKLSATAQLSGNAIVSVSCLMGTRAGQYNVSTMTYNFLPEPDY
ncbi:MAG: hypothetical protein ABIN74_05820 [Ferruginibacter sp.]